MRCVLPDVLAGLHLQLGHAPLQKSAPTHTFWRRDGPETADRYGRWAAPGRGEIFLWERCVSRATDFFSIFTPNFLLLQNTLLLELITAVQFTPGASLSFGHIKRPNLDSFTTNQACTRRETFAYDAEQQRFGMHPFYFCPSVSVHPL